MEDVARRTVEHEASRGRIRLGRCQWETFNDGFPNLRIHPDDAANLETSTAAFLGSVADPATIFEQLAVIYAIPRMRASNFRVIMPYFSTGTMERVEAPGQIATAATMARILSAVPHCATGPSSVVIYDIHALQEQFYFSDNVMIELKAKHSIAYGATGSSAQRGYAML